MKKSTISNFLRNIDAIEAPDVANRLRTAHSKQRLLVRLGDTINLDKGNRNILVMWVRCLFLDTEIDG